jgi:hypothetical protein
VFSVVTLFTCPLPKAICHQLKNVNCDYVLRVLPLLLELPAFLVVCEWELKMSTVVSHTFPHPQNTFVVSRNESGHSKDGNGLKVKLNLKGAEMLNYQHILYWV